MTIPSNPYSAPISTSARGGLSLRRLRILRNVSFVIGCLALMGGPLITVIAMLGSFQRQSTQPQIGPGELAADISLAMMISLIGIPIAAVAIGIGIWIAMILRRRSSSASHDA